MKMDQAYKIIHKLKDVIIIHLCLKIEDLHSFQMTPQVNNKNMLKNWVIVSIRLEKRVKIFRCKINLLMQILNRWNQEFILL
jgi:hypothetical protein